MKRILLTLLVMAVAIGSRAQEVAGKMPSITGIDHVAFYTTSPDSLDRLYTGVLGLSKTGATEPNQVRRYMVGNQWVGYSIAPDAKAANRLDHVAFRTSDAAALRVYLAGKGVKVPASVSTMPDASHSFRVNDPEGNVIEFVDRPRSEPVAGGDPVSRRLIHTGFIVHDRDAADRFYRAILGFKPYWHGGMKPGQTDWVSLQVPNGTDWLEYMLNQPVNPDLRLSGVMNHISLGVNDGKVAEAKLVSHGWTASGDEHSQMGLDGKWQLNVFDADLTRVELMSFRPVQKPCCSDFTGDHPSED